MKNEWAKIKDLFGKLNYILSKEQKKYSILIFLSSILAAAFETLGVSAILPLVEGFTNESGLKNKWYLQPFIAAFNIESVNILIYIVCAEIVLVYLVKNLYFMFYTWMQKKYNFKIRRELGIRIMESYMAQGYIFFVNNNSGKLLQGIGGDAAAVYAIIGNIFNLITKVITILFIGVYILIQEPFMAVSLLVLSGLCVTIIQVLFKTSMKKYGELQRIAAWGNNKACLEMIYGSKAVLVSGTQDYFKKRYSDSIVEQNKCSIKIEMAATIPAYIIETVCIIGLLLVIVIKIAFEGITIDMIESLSVIAIAAFRIMPAVGAVTSIINSIRSSIPSLNAAYLTIREVNELEAKSQKEFGESFCEDNKDINLQKEILINHVYYKYPQSEQYILENVSLRIPAKSFVGIIGMSGAGKSTLMDVLLGLLKPEKGNVLIDNIEISKLGRRWNQIIGYVPQSVFLLDDDIRTNIAFGIEKENIDDTKVWKALEMAQLAEFVNSLPNGLDTRVGERGVKFSGGQGQRVAIARALYTNPDILVLDEATAALDNETESSLMEAINSLQGKKTLIVIAHRLTTIKNCDFVYEVKDGKVISRLKEDVFGK